MNDLYEQLGLTEEEYKKKERRYKSELKSDIRSARQVIHNKIKWTFQISTDQINLRMLSWNYLSQRETVLLNQLNDTFGIVKMAKCPADVNNLQHFINAFCLALEYPNIEIPCLNRREDMKFNWIRVEEDELARLERQKELFEHLASKCDKEVKAQVKRVTINNVYDKLTVIEEKLDEVLNHWRKG